MNLYIWKYTFARVRERKIPTNESLSLSDVKLGKSIKGKWVSFNYRKETIPPKEEWKLPKILYLLRTRSKTFNNIDWLYLHHNVMLVSQRFLEFLQKNTFNQFEIAEMHIYNSSEKKRIDKGNYFAIRIFNFDDELFDFKEEERKRVSGSKGRFMYPNLELKQSSNKNVFFLNMFTYNECLILTEQAKNEILKEFIKPEIYKIEDFPLVYNNQMYSEKLPNMVK